MSRLRRLSPTKREFVPEEIENLLKPGIITPSSSPYASPINIIPKTGPKKFRMVGDYRALNNITQPDLWRKDKQWKHTPDCSTFRCNLHPVGALTPGIMLRQINYTILQYMDN